MNNRIRNNIIRVGLTAILFVSIGIIIYTDFNVSLKEQLRVEDLQQQALELDNQIKTINAECDTYRRYNNQLLEQIEEYKNSQKQSNRGSEKSEIMRVTAYDLSVESCGKSPSHPEYGITASGNKVKDWYTVAAGPSVPFGTKIYIPYFKDYPNKGIFTVEDRGSAIRDGCLDIFIRSGSDCYKFGVKYLEVYFIEDGGQTE